MGTERSVVRVRELKGTRKPLVRVAERLLERAERRPLDRAGAAAPLEDDLERTAE